MKNFVGCQLIEDTGVKGKMYLHQPKLLKHLEESFGNKVKDILRQYNAPAGPKSIIMRPHEGDNLISPHQQTIFRSGVGMLLYLVKHSRPDISNAVRELSKVADGATMGHWKALMRTSKYYALKAQPMTKEYSILKESQIVNMQET